MTGAEKYLLRHADAVAAEGGPWDTAVVLPLRRERELLPGLWESLDEAARGRRVIRIVVVNGRQEDDPLTRADNEATLRWLAERAGPDALVIDRSRHFTARDGVGTARKIGCDTALALRCAGRIREDWISTTDGDARVGPDYFSTELTGPAVGLGDDVVAAVHRFRHDVGPEDLPLALYEIHLRHYARGLREAGSPYGFFTVGSLLKFRLSAYGAVRGFPKRNAGEDFYLLEKLARLGKVAVHPDVVRLLPRPSDRVPFGTGASMSRIDTLLKGGKRYTLHPPEAFAALGAVMEAVNTLPPEACWRERLAPWGSPLEALGFFEMVETARAQRRRPEDFRRHVHTAFGALKTFQFVRAVSARHPRRELPVRWDEVACLLEQWRRLTP